MANDFSGSGAQALYRFEPSLLTVDSINTNTLTLKNVPTSDTSNQMEGAGCAKILNASDQGFYIPDASLSAGFPFKNSDTNKKMTFCGWYEPIGTLPVAIFLSKWITYNTFIVVANGSSWSVCVGTGHTISIGGVAQTTNYQSGSGSDTWTLRVPVLFSYSSAITYSYDQSAGNTTSVTWGTGTEMITTTNRIVSNQLTERIRFTLRRSSGDLAANETIKLAVNIYNGGTVDVIGTSCAAYNNQWMKQEMSLTTTTDANGVVDVAYTGASTVAGTVYIVVFRPDTSPTESMAWVDTVK